MKGTVRQPIWPAPTRDDSATKSAEKPTERVSRLQLALLDQLALANEQRGYNPYDTTPAGKPDIWTGKPKRR